MIQHEIQLTVYSYMIRQLLDRDESALEIRQLVKTKTPKIVVHRLPSRSDEHFRRFFDLVREYLDCLDRGVFTDLKINFDQSRDRKEAVAFSKNHSLTVAAPIKRIQNFSPGQ